MLYRRGTIGKRYSTGPPRIQPPAWLGGVPVRSVLRLLARHGDEQAGVPLDDLEVADDEAVVEDDRGVPLQLLVVRHRKDLHLGDPHPGPPPLLDASPD